MSLTSFLLGAGESGKKQSIDNELDAVFKSQVREDVRPAEPLNEKKRKSKKHVEEPSSKRSKSSGMVASEPPVKAPTKAPTDNKNARKVSGKKKGMANTAGSQSGEPGVKAGEPASSKPNCTDGSDTDGDDGDDQSHLLHETLRKDGSASSKTDGKKNKYVPSDETQEQKNSRTIFIGNLPPEVAQTRPLQKQLRRHILASLPTSKIESMRFRSIPFQTPTTKLPSDKDPSNDNKKVRQHDRDRASSWREVTAKDDTTKGEEKTFLTPNQKKKIAFINHDIHSNADSIHAYIVFAYPQPQESRPSNLPPPPPVMDPFEAARLAIKQCNGTVFMDRMLRVDLAGDPAAKNSRSTVGDPKLTVFVGNLGFSSKEDELRVFFESLVNVERGPPPSESGRDGAKPKTWVTRVRMIRDRDTQLGKGFAYVQFADRSCVDEILALEPEKLKFEKQKLRVQRCKTMQNEPTTKNTPPSKSPRAPVSSALPAVPKGDPSLGEKLAHLSKEERRQAKAADADRRARRMAKKKARMALAKQGVATKGKERERVRKSSHARKASTAAPPRKANKGRIRSKKSG
ncbi:hypothetical protein ID866_4285 [Astraeus odoratus]|nr:hypothetical protein ID866_4285 [Astraeus odoratus]